MKKVFCILTCFTLITTAGCQYPQIKEQFSGSLRPVHFYMKAHETKTAKIEHPWKEIHLTSNYAGRWIIAGDLDNDHEIEIVSAKSYNGGGYHYTTSVAVFHLDNSVFWEWGNPETGQIMNAYDVACQIYDIDSDGFKEVIVAADKELIVLNGLTGTKKWSFSIPDKASDCIVFANLSGNDRAEDILVKTRYSTIYAYTKTGTLLWSIKRPGGYRTAHQPYPVDMDGDGKDEIMAGYAMLNFDGSVRWTLDPHDLPLGDGHLDCIRIYEPGTSPPQFRFVITCCSDNAIAMIDGEGNVLWKFTGYHFESIDIGDIHPGYKGNEIFVDIDHCPWGESPACLFSGTGKLLGVLITNKSRRHFLIDWEGNGFQLMGIGHAQGLFNENHEKKIKFEIPGIPENPGIPIDAFTGYMNNDGVRDCYFIHMKSDYNMIDIFVNPATNGAEEYEPGTGINFTCY
ncbi:MAG: hypothetical protein JXB88_23850 [Spirochaetales bacterium]|nr:hypothetical protein [Spirochaetales bacterium]